MCIATIEEASTNLKTMKTLHLILGAKSEESMSSVDLSGFSMMTES